MYSAYDVAHYIIQKFNEMNKAISNLKLQKVLYFIQAEFLVDINKPCFFEEIEAWDFGPVVPTVYRKYKIYGSANIPFNSYEKKIFFLENDRKRIDEMIEQCSNFSASALVEITHRQSPWIESYKKGRNSVITRESIRSFFM